MAINKSTYDSDRWEFSRRLIEEQDIEDSAYLQFWIPLVSKKKNDTLAKNLIYKIIKLISFIKGHVGP